MKPKKYTIKYRNKKARGSWSIWWWYKSASERDRVLKMLKGRVFEFRV